jgi:hypothetical protein
MFDFSLLLTHWGITSFLLVLSLFLIYITARLLFTAFFKSYYETKKQYDNFKQGGEKNGKTNESN